MKDELLWAIDNIPPWDDFWETVPDKYVHSVIDISQGHNKSTSYTSDLSTRLTKNANKDRNRYKNWTWNPEGKRKARTGYGKR